MKREKQNDQLKVVTVIPVAKSIPKSTLSYFTKDRTSIGSFVKISIRGKEGLGLVTNITEARSVKSDLKNSSFALKKLSKGSSAELTQSFINACEKTANFYATTTGNILSVVIPKFFLENPELIQSKKIDLKKPETVNEPFLIQLPTDERFGEYKTIIRESFARRKSVLFVAPTI